MSLWFGVVTLFPEMIGQAAGHGVFRRACEAGSVTLATFNPRDHAGDRHGTVDDKPYGGGPGMVMMAEPLLAAIDEARAAALAWGASPRVLLMSPQGDPFTQAQAQALAVRAGAYILVCGRYEGVDERVLALAVDAEISVGDYVLSGGELPALTVMDAVARLMEGNLGNPDSLLSESHLDGLLEYPQYTRPEIVRGLGVPSELLSGDHKRVADFRRQQAMARTLERRPELLLNAGVLRDPRDRRLLGELLERQRQAARDNVG